MTRSLIHRILDYEKSSLTIRLRATAKFIDGNPVIHSPQVRLPSLVTRIMQSILQLLGVSGRRLSLGQLGMVETNQESLENQRLDWKKPLDTNHEWYFMCDHG